MLHAIYTIASFPAFQMLCTDMLKRLGRLGTRLDDYNIVMANFPGSLEEQSSNTAHAGREEKESIQLTIYAHVHSSNKHEGGQGQQLHLCAFTITPRHRCTKTIQSVLCTLYGYYYALFLLVFIILPLPPCTPVVMHSPLPSV